MSLLTAWDNQERIIKGVCINGLPLGGKEYSEVMEILAIEEKRVQMQKIFLHIPGGGTLETNYAAAGITVDKDRTWQEAYAQGHTGVWWQRWRSRWLVERQGYSLPLYLLLNRDSAQQVLGDLTEPLHKQPKDAQFQVLSGDKVKIVEDVYGEATDPAALADLLEHNILAYPGQVIHLPVEMVKIRPVQTAEDLKGFRIEGLVSRFTTQFVAERVNRTKNIQLAAAALDGVLIQPGEMFSFNQTVGPRDFARGYGEADIIINNELVPGIGGGVCQVSTTLYNAVLRANLEIVERHPHSLVIPYAQAGLDATVAYGGKDLRFRNNTVAALMLKTSVNSGVLSVKIFGLPVPEETVRIISRMEKEIPFNTKYLEDPNVPEGQYILEREGSPGILAHVEREIYSKKGQLVRREVISRDLYPPQDRIIRTLSTASLLLEPDNL